jgi:hypothetical protein
VTVLSSDVRTLSAEAYTYFYPLVTMELTRRQQTNLPAGARPGFGPPNSFHHIRQFPDADFRAVVRPNFDTLYSTAWLDLTRGGVRVHIPDSGGRYYLLPILDMWTDVFAVPGKRTTGTAAQDFVVVGPGGGEGLPAGVPVIHSPTPHAWVIARTQTNGPADYTAVAQFQDGLSVTELFDASPWQPDAEADTVTEPLRLVNAMSAVEFFTHAAEVLKANPPHATDFSQLARIALLGIVPGESFDPSRFGPAEIAELEAGAAQALSLLSTALPRLGVPSNGWVSFLDTMGVYGNHYLKRAAMAMAGLGANPVEDAIYPLLVADADGEPLTGERD